jgi:predicted dehydrogenase
MDKLRVGLVGLGFMGAGHLENLKLLEEKGFPVRLTAICDVDGKKLNSANAGYALYRDINEMLKNEDLDMVDICLPTYLHAATSVQAMEAGLHVFCEKPMAMNADECQQMIDASKKTGKRLMIGHCLRYWDAYEYLKEVVEDGRYGACTSAYFFRGGVTPTWSWENWLMQKDKSGGCLLDQHVHDVDVVNWLFGLPVAVSSVGINKIAGGGYDAVSTNYIYTDKVVNAQDDWTINGGGFGFEHTYRVNFEKGAIIFKDNKTTVHPVGGEAFEPKLSGESGYFKELRLFLGLIQETKAFDYIKLLESHLDSIRLAEAEQLSCDRLGEKIGIINL